LCILYDINIIFDGMNKRANLTLAKKTVETPSAPAFDVPKEAPPSHLGEDVVEEFISEKRIGERIKKLRLKKSMGLAEMASHTGLSASFLSQLETGRVVPTLRNLTRIAMVFSKDLSYFFEPEPKTLFRIHRRAERLRLPETGAAIPTYFFESLGYLVPERQIDPYFAEFLPGQHEHRSHRHEGCEFLFVSSGALEIHHGTSINKLEAGDAVYFDSGTVHSYICSGDQPATALIVTSQRPWEAASAKPSLSEARPDNNGRRPARELLRPPLRQSRPA
jgi:transcriptional regulator with XRE-family HTH domain